MGGCRHPTCVPPKAGKILNSHGLSLIFCQRQRVGHRSFSKTPNMSLPQPVPPSWKVFLPFLLYFLGHSDTFIRILASLPMTYSARTTISTAPRSRSRPKPPPTLPSRSKEPAIPSPMPSMVISRVNGPTRFTVSPSPRPGPPPTSSATKSSLTTLSPRVSSLTSPPRSPPTRAAKALSLTRLTSSQVSTLEPLLMSSRSGRPFHLFLAVECYLLT